jgi:hypothetical protein
LLYLQKAWPLGISVSSAVKDQSPNKNYGSISTGYDLAEWDMVSNRSDGEYLSLSEDFDDEGDILNPESPTFSDLSSESS